MLVGLDDFVAANNGKDMLIMLHQMGNHGPMGMRILSDMMKSLPNSRQCVKVMSLPNANISP